MSPIYVLDPISDLDTPYLTVIVFPPNTQLTVWLGDTQGLSLILLLPLAIDEK